MSPTLGQTALLPGSSLKPPWISRNRFAGHHIAWRGKSDFVQAESKTGSDLRFGPNTWTCNDDANFACQMFKLWCEKKGVSSKDHNFNVWIIDDDDKKKLRAKLKKGQRDGHYKIGQSGVSMRLVDLENDSKNIQTRLPSTPEGFVVFGRVPTGEIYLLCHDLIVTGKSEKDAQLDTRICTSEKAARQLEGTVGGGMLSATERSKSMIEALALLPSTQRMSSASVPGGLVTS